MYAQDFAARLTLFRKRKGISARNMSFSLGQNAGYIHNIEKGKAFPSMENFFNICEFLGVSPSEFFEVETDDPAAVNDLVKNLKKLDSVQVESISVLVRGLIK